MDNFNSGRRAVFSLLGAAPLPLVAQIPTIAKSGNSPTGESIKAARSVAFDRYGAEDVRHYGAVGDGITDDTVALQKAFQSAVTATGSTTLVLPAGLKVRISSYCEIYANTTLHLLGVLQLSERRSGLFANNASNIGIYGFKSGVITDSSVASSYTWNPGAGNIAPAIHIRSGSNVLIDGVSIDHCSQGIFVSNASQNFTTNAAFTPTQPYPSFVRVQNCRITFCEWSGCATLSSYDSGYYDNYVYRCGDGGIWMMGSINGEVVGNHRVSPLAVRADVLAHGQNHAAHPTTWNDVQGMEFENCHDLLISRNVVENIQGEAIDIKQGCNRVICSENRIVNSEQYSIVVREGDAGDVNACGKVLIASNTISSHGYIQFSNEPTGVSAAISVSSAFITEILNNVIHSYKLTPGIQCLGPGRYQAGRYARNPQQASLSVNGNMIEFNGANPYDKTEFPFNEATLGAIVINGEYTSVCCSNNRISTDRYYVSDDRLNQAPAIALHYAQANGSCYPTSAIIMGNVISGWGSDGIVCAGIATIPFSGLNISSNTIGNCGGVGLRLENTNYALCNNNVVTQPTNMRRSVVAISLAGSDAHPLRGVLCCANSLTGCWNTGGISMDYCMSIESAEDLNLTNNRMSGAVKADISVAAISGNLFFQGSTGFPRSGSGNPNGAIRSYWSGEEYFDDIAKRWWKAIGFQSMVWVQATS